MANRFKISYVYNRDGVGYLYKIINKNTVSELEESEYLQLPYKKTNVSKDELWNAKKINSELLQSINRGETIQQMSERLKKVTDMNKQAAIRNARTMTTSFENKGRIDSMNDMERQGVIIQKEWSATHDDKTRASHSELDGQTAEINEPFKSILGDIMYPGDPSAEPANVYNCRCTMYQRVVGFKSTLPKGTIKEVK